jgi:YEATS family
MHVVASHWRIEWGKRLTQNDLSVKKVPPFRIEEDGWGEFVIEITLTDLAGKDHPITHDLNFASERYEYKHVLTFKNPKGELAAALRASGPVPGDAGGDMVNGKKGGRISGISGADGEGKKIWIRWRRSYSDWERTICCRLCRWCMIINPRTAG